ncbi:hypothetical protein GQ44DRAFT_286531 [Phaeosphaeriaceae sp. PMI808]|nr:hypothetical protein GQ44DRAFT_286531 [Phaeosphaeriaceae sp. PMI808]
MDSLLLSQRDQAVGVIPPPPGITPDFTNPPSRAHTLLTVHIVFMIISTLFIGLRLYTAQFILRYIRVDDYMILIAWFFALVFSVLSITSTQYGFGRHLWDVPFPVFNPNFIKFVAISSTFVGISIMLIKLSILTLFLRFVSCKSLRVVIYTIMAIVIIYSLVTSFLWVYTCQPLEKFWDLTVTGGSCIDWQKIPVFNGIMNTTTDTAILILPGLFLRKVQLPKRQKIGIIVVLMTGGFILVVSVIRLKFAVAFVNTIDISWEGIIPAVWWTIEVHTAIVCACISAGKPFLRKHMPKALGSSYNAGIITSKLRTIRSTHTQRLGSRDAGDDPQDATLKGDTARRSLKNVSTAAVEIGLELHVRTEYDSDRGLIIMGGQETADGGP